MSIFQVVLAFGANHFSFPIGKPRSVVCVISGDAMNIQKIGLDRIEPNRWRRLDLDPIDPDRVKAIAKSYQDNGAFAPICGKWTGDKFELAAGHHRIEAAQFLGHKTIDAAVENYNDIDMWSVGSAENLTQRTDAIGASLDSCAGLIRLIARLVFNGRDDELAELVREPPDDCPEVTGRPVETIRGHIESGRGVGRDTILNIHKARGGVYRGTPFANIAH